MKTYWYVNGLTDSGAELADKLLPSVKKFIKKTEKSNAIEISTIVIKEAFFQLFELPKRTKEFQKRYLNEDVDKNGNIKK